ncbi:MAG: hypothetical protein IJI88_07315 [Atopobiaceae bacterium]|nr:hypothetical protein [Olsenella sp.]MBQ6492067.1 hypothetical protein [Atopobiaceae bacterium]
MDRDVRRLRSALTISSVAFITLGAWGILKMVGLLFVSPDSLRDLLRVTMGDAVDGPHALGASTFVLSFILGIGFIVRLVVGLGAFAEGRGRNRGWLYVVIAALMLVGRLNGIIQPIIVSHSMSSLVDTFIPGITEIASTIALADMTISAIRLKLLTRASREGR